MDDAELVRRVERVGGGRDHDQLEGRPTHVLRDVQDRRRVRAAPAERRPHEHHAREPALSPDVAGEAEERAADRRADEGREKGPGKTQPREIGSRDEHEEADAEVAPEKREVAQGERAQPLGNRCDAP